MPIKHPLITIGVGNKICRLEPRKHKSEVGIVDIYCPISDRECRYGCTFLGLVDSDKLNEPPGLICKAFHSGIPIGFLDMDSIDLDKYESLKMGSEIADRLKKEMDEND
jgi:hypothetical protein